MEKREFILYFTLGGVGVVVVLVVVSVLLFLQWRRASGGSD